MNGLPKVDRWARTNVLALEILSSDGHSVWNGISRSTIRAFARRGLVHDLGDGRAIVAEVGNQLLAGCVNSAPISAAVRTEKFITCACGKVCKGRAGFANHARGCRAEQARVAAYIARIEGMRSGHAL